MTNNSSNEREELILRYAPLVKIIAMRLAMRLPSHIDVEDLINVGIAGLLESIDRFDPEKGVKIETFLSFRIRGSMLDELRRMDWMPRSVRQKARQLEEDLADCEEQLGRVPNEEDMAKYLNMDIEDYYRFLQDASGVAVLSLEDMGFSNGEERRSILESFANPGSEDPVEKLNLKEDKLVLADKINTLPEKEKLVLSLYYYNDLNLKEIGKVIGVSESRVSQLHTQAIIRLKKKLRDALNR